MNMNPAAIMALLQAKAQFDANHPKFSSFLGYMIKNGIEEGAVIEVSVQKPDGQKVTSNIRVQQSDLELLQQLKQLAYME